MNDSAKFHEMVLEHLVDHLHCKYPDDYLERNLFYPNGEIDLLRITPDERIIDYEVKGRDSIHARLKAGDQLWRSARYWYNNVPNHLIQSHYVGGIPKEMRYVDFEFIDGLFIPIEYVDLRGGVRG